MHSNVYASGSVPNNDTDSSVVPGKTSEQRQGGQRQGEFSDVDEADMEKAGSGQMDRNKERVQQAGSGGREATTSLPGKQERGQKDQSGVQDNNAQKQVRCLLCRTAWAHVCVCTCTLLFFHCDGTVRGERMGPGSDYT